MFARSGAHSLSSQAPGLPIIVFALACSSAEPPSAIGGPPEPPPSPPRDTTVEEVLDRSFLDEPRPTNAAIPRTLDTPLHDAVRRDDLDRARTLLQAGMPVNVLGALQRTPFHAACAGGNLDMVFLLHSRGADIMARDWRGSTPMHYAAREGHVDILQHLAFFHANAQAKDDRGFTLLHEAAAFGTSESVQWALWQHGTRVDARTTRLRRTPLHFAALRAHGDILKRLLAAGADPEARDALERTAMEVFWLSVPETFRLEHRVEADESKSRSIDIPAWDGGPPIFVRTTTNLRYALWNNGVVLWNTTESGSQEVLRVGVIEPRIAALLPAELEEIGFLDLPERIEFHPWHAPVDKTRMLRTPVGLYIHEVRYGVGGTVPPPHVEEPYRAAKLILIMTDRILPLYLPARSMPLEDVAVSGVFRGYDLDGLLPKWAR